MTKDRKLHTTMTCLFEQAQVAVGSSTYPVLRYTLTSSKSGPDVSNISFKEGVMPIYIALTNVSAEGRKAIKEDPARIKANNREIEAMGVKILGQYATLGQYDFINIFEAPNDDAIFKVALNLTGRGVDQVQTLAAKTLDDFIATTKSK